MRIIHSILGPLILFFDWLTSPQGIKRSQEAQSEVNDGCRSLILYQYKACPFCVKVRRTMKRLSLPIETRDPKRSIDAMQQLNCGAGNIKVPCLRIADDEGDVQWMFESGDIIEYLEGRFAESHVQLKTNEAIS